MKMDEETFISVSLIEGLLVDEVLNELLSTTNGAHVTRLLSTLEWEEFIDNQARLEKLVELYRTKTDATSPLEEASKSELLVAITTIFICAEVNISHDALFDNLVRHLWGLISGDNANVFETRQLRSTACECLREIERSIPGALEALARPRGGEDDRSLLERLVVAEHSSTFQQYLVLLLTILVSSGNPTESTVMRVVAMMLESAPLCSKWNRAALFHLAFELLKTINPEAIPVLWDRAISTLAHSTFAPNLEVLTEMRSFMQELADVQRSNGGQVESGVNLRRENQLDGQTKRDQPTVFDHLLDNIVRDNSVLPATRRLACEIRSSVLPLHPKTMLPSTFDPLGIAVLNAKAFLIQVHHSHSASDQLLSTTIHFAEDFWRENPPGRLTDGAFEVISTFIQFFPEHIDQVADMLVHGATLRGGPYFFKPITRIVHLDSNGLNSPEVRVILERVAEAVLDAKDDHVGGFLEVLQLGFYLTNDPNVRKRILLALKRFIELNSYDQEEMFQFVDCCRVVLWRGDTRTLRFCERLLVDFKQTLNDSVMSEEIQLLIECGKAFQRGNKSAGKLLSLVDNAILRRHMISSKEANDDDADPHRETIVSNQTSYNEVVNDTVEAVVPLQPMKQKTVVMDRLVRLSRSSPDLQLIRDDSSLRIPVTIEWLGGDAANDALFSLEIFVLSSPSLTFKRPPLALHVPILSTTSPSWDRVLEMEPISAGPIRLTFRAIATLKDGTIVEGSLPSLSVEFRDFFSSPIAKESLLGAREVGNNEEGSLIDNDETSVKGSMPANALNNLRHATRVVRERWTRQMFDHFSSHQFDRFITYRKLSPLSWEAMLRIKPDGWMLVAAKHDEITQVAVFDVRVTDWVLMGFLDELFRTST